MLDLQSIATLGKVLGTSLLIILIGLVVKHFQAVKRVHFYTEQGMSALPGYRTFFIGNMKNIMEYRRESERLKGIKPISLATSWIHDQLHPEEKPAKYDASRDPVSVVNFGTNIHLFVGDPDMAQDLFTVKNQIYDKTGTQQTIWEKLLGSSFLFARADATWKAKRKACAHAFYKERLVHMLEVLKDKLTDRCELWSEQIARSKDQSAEINITEEFMAIFARNIIHISFGEDVSDKEIEILYRTDIEGISPPIKRKVKFYQALGEAFEQGALVLKLKVSNPVYRVVAATTGANISFTKFERAVDQNFLAIRAFVTDYVRQRKQGLSKSTVQKDADMLSLFMESPEVFTEDFIVDELLDFFVAATQTTQHAMQTIVGHFSTVRESLLKVRGEAKAVIAVNEDPDDVKSLLADRKRYLKKFLTLENCQELSYSSCVILEALRFMPPVPHSTVSDLSQDSKIGKYHIKAGDNVQVNIVGLHRNKNEWQRPNEFLPGRFDSSNPLSLTPSGSKRKTFSFCPFIGGKRVCFGKTFAELNLKMASTYMSQYFNMEYVDKEKHPDTNSLPLAQLGQSEHPAIMVRLTPPE